MTHRDLRRRVYYSLAGEVLGFVFVSVGIVMYAVPTDRSIFFELWIKNVDVAPAIVGFLGVVLWGISEIFRRAFLAEINRLDHAINRELEERKRNGQADDAEFLSRLSDAVSFHSLRRRTSRIVYVLVLILILTLVGATLVGAIWSYRETGLGSITIAVSGLFVFSVLGLIRHIWERPR